MKRGQYGVTGTAVAVVIVAVLIMIGALVFAYVRDSLTTPMNSLNSAGLNASIATMESNTYAGFDLLSVSVIVLAAVAIIGTIFLLGRPGGG